MEHDTQIQGMIAAFDTLAVLEIFEKSMQIRKPSITDKGRMLLHVLKLIGRMDETEIARTFCIASSSASDQVKTLAERGLVKKAPDPEDARRNFIEITPEGRSELEKAQLSKGNRMFHSLLNAGEEERILLFLSQMAEGQDLLRTMLRHKIEPAADDEI